MQQPNIRHILQTQTFSVPPLTQQQQDVQCCDTKIWIWDQDGYEQYDSDYLNQIFPYKINKNTMKSGCKFIFHFLSSSLNYYVELIEEETNKNKNYDHQSKENNNDDNIIMINNNNNQNNTQNNNTQNNNTQNNNNKVKDQEKLGIKDFKFIKQIFEQDQTDNWIAFRRWGQQFMQKDKFLQQQSKQSQFQPPAGGQLIHSYTRNSVIYKYYGNNVQFSKFKQRMQVLFLFYIDGVSFVTQQVDTWVYFLIFKKQNSSYKFVGVLSQYIFKLSTTKQRHRISQVFILPIYQKYGHGKQLIDIVYKLSLQDDKCFEITTEIPSYEYQCLRDYKQAEMIINANIINMNKITVAKNAEQIKKNRDQLLQKDVLREIKNKLKLPGHQIQRIVHIFIFQRIITSNNDMARAHFQEYLRQKIIFNRSPFKSREKLPHITFFGQSPQMKEFYLQKAKEDFLRNQTEIQQLLTQTINGYIHVINKLKKMKII